MGVEDKQLSPLEFLGACLSWLQETGIGQTLISGIAGAVVGLWLIGGYYVAAKRKKARLEGRVVRPVWEEFVSALFISGMLVVPLIGYALGGLFVLYLGYIIFGIFTHPS